VTLSISVFDNSRALGAWNKLLPRAALGNREIWRRVADTAVVVAYQHTKFKEK
jgi:hypothetical protein